MANAKATDLTPLVAAADGDVLYIVDDPGGSPISKKITMANLRHSMLATIVVPSGDATGAADLAAIQAALDDHGSVQLINGTYYVNAAIAMNVNEQSLFGQGNLTSIRHFDDSTPIIKITKSRITVKDVMIWGGTYGIEIDGLGTGSISNTFDNVWVYGATSHGLYGHAKTWTNRIIGGSYSSNTGDGINLIGTTTEANGNASSITGARISSNGGHGIAWCGTGLHIAGCCLELNTDSGIYVHTVNNRNAVGANIVGNYLEENGIASIEFETTTGEVISGVNVDGNIMTNPVVPNVLATGITGSVYYLHLGPGNYYNVSGGADPIQLGSICVSATVYGTYDSELTMTNRESNVVHFRRSSSPVITERRNVNAAAGGTAQTTNLVTLPAGSILHNVVAHTVVAFNGDAGKTLEVGIVGNIDKYIDTADFDPATLNDWQAMTGGGSNDQGSAEFMSAALTLIATWTNTASASAGSVDVYVTYSMRPAAAQ